MPKQKPNEQVQQIPLSEIRPFKNHPFKVTDDELMQQTIDSIMKTIPAIVRNLDDDEAVILKSGKPISLMELAQAARREQAQAARQEKKPSVLAKLCPPVNEPKKTARSKRTERELL